MSLRIATSLAAQGHDVIRAARTYPTASDSELLRIAHAESRFLVTEDGDFTDLIFAHDEVAPIGLIFIRCEPFEHVAIVKSILDVIEDQRLLGHVAVVTARQVRYRAFPKDSEKDA